MAIFGKRKEEPQEQLVEQAPVDEFVPPAELPEVEDKARFDIPDAMPMTPERRVDQTADNLAPVFVRISKYRDILNTVNYLKMGFGVIRGQIAIMNKLMRLEKDNMDLLYAALDKVNGQLMKLDSDFTKPVDFMREVADMKATDVHEIDSVMGDLKSQIDKLKSEVDTLA